MDRTGRSHRGESLVLLRRCGIQKRRGNALPLLRKAVPVQAEQTGFRPLARVFESNRNALPGGQRDGSAQNLVARLGGLLGKAAFGIGGGPVVQNECFVDPQGRTIRAVHVGAEGHRLGEAHFEKAGVEEAKCEEKFTM